ncbi:hypothetical protein Adt_18471 [Abeliophyllum distichum]|uniref:Uncharacterized protein n=1 Tax=Abeliophyllum distichum TaxID=126358 RepID=A0ABD1TJH9_9LAMI
MDIALLFGMSLTTPSIHPLILVYWRTLPVRSHKVNTYRCVEDGFASGKEIFRDSSGLYSQIYGLRLTLFWPFTASPEVEDFGRFRQLFATSDISFPSTVILFLIFIVRTTR